ncbi:pre-peptidase C-terminal domain-containing protein [Lysobacter firmicutimachus]|uniref:Pre-peptidase C-terminal domain-containing protein n=1 Tax=Lysobacter firmicutimachus TaxID=1792846 RepID=A0ABU8CXR4_9GAMM
MRAHSWCVVASDRNIREPSRMQGSVDELHSPLARPKVKGLVVNRSARVARCEPRKSNNGNQWNDAMTSKASASLRPLIAFGVLALGSYAQAGQPLFVGEIKPSATSLRVTGAAGSPGASQLRIMKLNAATVSENSSEIEVDLGGDRVTLVLESARHTDSGSLLWVGHVRETSKSRRMTGREVVHDALNSVILVRRGDNVTGSVRINGALFSIRPLSNGEHAVERVEESASGHDEVLSSPGGAPKPAQSYPQRLATGAVGPAALNAGEQVTIRVMAAVTKDAIASYGADIRSLVERGIAEANLGYSNSRTGITLELTSNILEMDYPSGSDQFVNLERAINPADGYMDQIHTARNAESADVVLLITRPQGFISGIAHLNADESKAIALVSVHSMINNYTVGHEISHLLGAGHDSYTNPGGNSYFRYGQGHCAADGSLGTIMTYAWSCPGWSVSSARVNYYSSPELTYNGRSLGTADLNDNRRVLIENKHRVAAFRGAAPVNLAPVADFSFTAKDLAVTFADRSVDSDGSIVSRSWSFGDGTSSTDAAPSRTYAKAGTYTVTLTVTDNRGVSRSTSKSVTVSAPASSGASLSNRVPVTGISGSMGSYQHWTLLVPPGASRLKFSISGYSGDADLYVKYGSAPTTTSYDCRANLGAGAETCNIPTSQAGTYHVMVNGWSAFSGMSLVGSYEEGGAAVLVNGVAQTGLSGATGSYRFWTMQVPSGASNVQFATSGYTGDADLYVKYGSAPTPTNYDCRAYLGAGAETCRLSDSKAGTYHILVNGYTAYSGMRLVGSYATSDSPSGSFGTLSNGVSVNNVAGAQGSYQYWAMTVPFGATDLVFTISGYRGDADLYVKRGSSPTATNYECRANLGSGLETCRISNVQAGTYYVMVNGWSDFSGMSVAGSYR